MADYELDYPLPPRSGIDDPEFWANFLNARVPSPGDKLWRHYQRWLKVAGYHLRARFQPEWMPSWSIDEDSGHFEDGLPASESELDATRNSDGLMVLLKRTDSYIVSLQTKISIIFSSTPPPHENELNILRFFSSAPLALDSKNHCVPLLESFRMPHDTETTMVFPFLAPCWYLLQLETIGEGVAFMEQIIEGVYFMHENRVAHGKLDIYSIMFDAAPMYPSGFHPEKMELPRSWTGREPSGFPFLGRVKHYTSTQRPVRYYLSDFSQSKRFDSMDGQPRARFVIPSAPEHGQEAWRVACDPFAVDVYCLGRLIRESIIEKYPGFEFVEELVNDMTKDAPEERPRMDEVVARFKDIHATLPWWKLRAFTADRDAFGFVRALWFLPYLFRLVCSVLTRKAAVPVPPANLDHLGKSKDS